MFSLIFNLKKKKSSFIFSQVFTWNLYWNLKSWERINWNLLFLFKACKNTRSPSPGAHRYDCARALVCCPASRQLQRVTLLSEKLSLGGVWHGSSMVTLGQRSEQCRIHRSSSLFERLLYVIEAGPLSYGKTVIYLIELVTTASQWPR